MAENNFGNIYAWLFLLMGLLQYILMAWCYRKCFAQRCGTFAGCALFVLPLMIPTFIEVMFKTAIPMKTLLLGLMIAALVFLLSEERNVIKSVIFSCVLILVMGVSELIILAVNNAVKLTEFNEGTIFVYSADRIMTTVACVVLMMPLLMLTANIWNKILGNSSFQGKLSYMLFPIGICLCSITVIYFIEFSLHMTTEERHGYPAVAITVGLALITAANFFNLYYISELEKKLRLEREVKELEYAYSVEEERYRDITAKNYETEKIRHDIKNQLIAIRALLESGSGSEAERLLTELEQSVAGFGRQSCCSVPIIDAVLSEKAETARREGKKFTAEVSIKDAGNISAMHLCSVFGNLTDNALKSCGEGGYVKLRAASEGGYIAIFCENSAECEDKILRPSDSRGYGLRILADIAERYDGVFKGEIKDGKCSCEIMLKR